MNNETDKKILFEEKQRFQQKWLWVLIVGITGLTWYMFIQQIIIGVPFGSNPASDTLVWIIFILIGFGLPWLLISVKLITHIDSDGIHIRFFPFVRKKILISDIKSFAVREYHPLREYGGLGIRWSPSKGMGYIISGNIGVQLELTNGKKILIGSQKADEFVSAIETAMHR